MLRRLMTIGRCRRIFSEIELIAIASTNFVATAAKLCGTIFVATFAKLSGIRLSTKEPLSPKIPIFTFSFDDFVLDRFNFSRRESQRLIVSPTFSTRRSDFTLRFFISFASKSIEFSASFHQNENGCRSKQAIDGFGLHHFT